MVLYSDIEPRWVRLLKFHTGEHDSIIICDMVTCCLDDTSCLEYAALSYTWGSESPIFEIQVNDIKFQVRSNLLHALKRIRAIQGHVEGISDGSYWWIDSICINQQNDVEKGHQVAMMGNIFERSKVTVAYLGEQDNDGLLAMQMLREIASSPRKEASRLIAYGITDQLNALATFFERPWWTRAWTTQEYILPDTLYFLCGDQSLRRRDFQMALLRLEKYSRALPEYRSVHQTSGFTMAGKRKKILNRRYDVLQGVGYTPNFPLCDYLVYAGGCNASLERDCVYSALPLVISTQDDLQLKPYYGDGECVKIFEEVVRSQIALSNCLDIMCFADASPRYPEIRCPSWVPYWPNHTSQASDHMAWQSFPALASKRKPVCSKQLESNGNNVVVQSHIFKASAGLPAAVQDDSQPGVLFCQAREQDEAVQLRGARPIPRVMDDIVISTSHQNQDGEKAWWKQALEYQPPQDLWKTVTLDRKDSYLDKPAPLDYSNDFKRLLFKAIEDPAALNTKTLLWFRHHAPVLFASHSAMDEIIERLNDTPGCARVISKFEDQMHHVWINMRKRLMLVSDKQVWGMATEGAMVGDVICVLAGCNFPVLLRQTERRGWFRLIGECYVDGIMHGEMVGLDTDGVPSMEDIYLV
ncbi:heterokaryon incompatibility protein-domain-containing protein [Xylogone sp. PMI_703]|nr:heterokaryon incompatibility protein-domain-containing protein [Xylogone sp. PMI_703]